MRVNSKFKLTGAPFYGRARFFAACKQLYIQRGLSATVALNFYYTLALISAAGA